MPYGLLNSNQTIIKINRETIFTFRKRFFYQNTEKIPKQNVEEAG